MKIIKANSKDASTLTDLTMRSKAHWNYSEKQLESWREELTISENYIEENPLYKLVEYDRLLGFYAFENLDKTNVKLNYLFIEPKHIGKGYGKLLMEDFLKRMKKSGVESVVLDADPNAEEFYSKFGFTVIGKLSSSIKDRFLPIMELRIDV